MKKKIKLVLPTGMDLSEVALEEAIKIFRQALREERDEELFMLKLSVSVFDTSFAVTQMVTDKMIGEVIISKHLNQGQWRLETWSGEFYMIEEC